MGSKQYGGRHPGPGHEIVEIRQTDENEGLPLNPHPHLPHIWCGRIGNSARPPRLLHHLNPLPVFYFPDIPAAEGAGLNFLKIKQKNTLVHLVIQRIQNLCEHPTSALAVVYMQIEHFIAAYLLGSQLQLFFPILNIFLQDC